MNNKKYNIELMAPAGDFAALQSAINSGANSIYFGVDQLNMRARATMNFTFNDLKEISRRCREKGVKTYLTLNTIIYNHDLSIAKKIVQQVKENNIDAIIASDQAIINICKNEGVEVHISTQLNITNIETVKFYSNFADVMVLSRELSMKQIKEICDGIKKDNITGPNGKLIEIEVFGHGALCVAVSGKCYMSLHTHNSSANRGACIQNCRRKYKVIDIEDGYELEIDNEYIMSPQDLCTIDFLDKLIDCGISVLKIEGRGRAAEYVETTIKCYREAIDSLNDGTYNQERVQHWMTELSKVYNRGFWGGYYLGEELGKFTDKSGSSATQNKIFVGVGQHYFPKSNIAQFELKSHSIEEGNEILIIGPTTGTIRHVLSEIWVNDNKVTKAKKGEVVTFKLDNRIRMSDKLYKIVEVN